MIDDDDYKFVAKNGFLLQVFKFNILLFHRDAQNSTENHRESIIFITDFHKFSQIYIDCFRIKKSPTFQLRIK